MNLVNRMMAWLKSIFMKQEPIKQLEAPKMIESQEKKRNFIESLKITTAKKMKKNKIETLTCVGDGLGIQKRMSC